MKRFLLVAMASILMSIPSVMGQMENIDKEQVKTASRLFRQKNYDLALDQYLALDSLADGDVEEFQYYIALCYLNLKEDRTKAIPYLEYNRGYFYEEGLEEDYFYHLGTAYHLDYRFDEAILNYDKFLQLSAKRDKRRKTVERSIEMCMNAKSLVNNPIDVDIENLGSKINSNYAEHTPVISADESVIIFNSNRAASTGGKMNEFGERDSIYGKYFDDIFVSISINNNWMKPVKIGGGLNTEQHDDVVSISPDGQQLFVYRSDSVLYGNIFYCKAQGYSWGPLQKMPAPINSKYMENSGSINADGTAFYFSSNRPGGTGEGDFDIYMVRKLPDGSWAEVQNIGTMINTKYNEYAPFIHPDGKTLYFSSKGHNSMGGYDIFKSTYVDGQWTVPVNLGHPVNTPDDDVDFYLSGDGKRGYYSSAKPGGSGEKDLYVINFNQEFKDVSPGPVTIIKGKVINCAGEIVQGAKIKLVDNMTSELMGVYTPNTATGKYMIIVPKGADYSLTVEAPEMLTFSKNIVTPINEIYKEEKVDLVLCSQDSSACLDLCSDGSYEKSVEESIVGMMASSLIALDDQVSTIKNRSLSINVWKNDFVEGSELKKEGIKLIDKPLHGVAEYDEDLFEFDYQPSLSFSGKDSFSYKICASNGDCGQAWVYISVIEPGAKNLAPNVRDDNFDLLANEATSIDILANDSDEDGTINFASLNISEVPAHGSVNIDISGQKIIYTPDSGYVGRDQFTYKLCDNGNLCDEAIVLLKVVSEEPPVILDNLEDDVPIMELAEEMISSVQDEKIGKEEKEEQLQVGDCWEGVELGSQITVYNIYFNYDKSNLREDSKKNLESLICFMKLNPNLKIEVGAHTDSRGAEWYNKKLSEDRANSVRNYLISEGVNPDNVRAAGYGETTPVYECPKDISCTEEQHQVNRRTTFLIYGDELKFKSEQPDVIEVNPRPGSAYLKQIDERSLDGGEKNAYDELLKTKGGLSMAGLTYRVQIAAFNAEVKSADWFEGVEISKVSKVKANHYRYFSKNFKTMSEAHQYMNSVKGENFKYAFVVAKLNGMQMKWKALKDILIK